MTPTAEQAYQQTIREQAETIRRQAEIIRRQQRRIAEWEAHVARLTAQLAQRDATIARLQQQVAALSAQVARLSKDSATSSRPRSSDITKPPKSPAPAGGPRRIGGQPGHARHERKAGRRAPPRGEAQDLADGP